MYPDSRVNQVGATYQTRSTIRVCTMIVAGKVVREAEDERAIRVANDRLRADRARRLEDARRRCVDLTGRESL